MKKDRKKIKEEVKPPKAPPKPKDPNAPPQEFTTQDDDGGPGPSTPPSGRPPLP